MKRKRLCYSRESGTAWLPARELIGICFLAAQPPRWGFIDRLRKDGRTEHVNHRRVHRPWGTYDTLDSGPGFQVKRLTIDPGASISLQMHRHRAEHWVVVAGTARVTRGDEVFLLHENESAYVSHGTRHRIENPTDDPLQIVEVQTGEYLGEDDIVRYHDNYARS